MFQGNASGTEEIALELTKFMGKNHNPSQNSTSSMTDSEPACSYELTPRFLEND